MVLNGNVEFFTVSNNIVHDNDNIGIDFIGFEGENPDPALDRARDGTVVGNLVYIGSTDGRLYALDRESGAKRWALKTGARVVSSPAVADGRVYVLSYDDTLYSANAETGAVVWKFATRGEHRYTATNLHGTLPRAESMPDPYDTFLSSPAVWNGAVYFGSSDGHDDL